MKLKDETGNRYGKLVVLERAGSYNYRGSLSVVATWMCQCDCGNKTVVHGAHLRSGATQSCSCLVGTVGPGRRLPKGESAFRRIVRSYARSAAKADRVWELTNREAKTLMGQPCHYCGGEPNNISFAKKDNGAFIYNGLDRLDNSKGYTLENVVPCCWACNRAKGKGTYQEFLTWLDQIAAWRRKEI